LKSKKVTFNIFHGQHNHQIWISLNHYGQFCRLEDQIPSPPTSLNQLEDVLQEEWYKIPLKTVQNLYKIISRRTAAVLKAKGVEHHINIEMCTASVAFPLFCPTLYFQYWMIKNRWVYTSIPP
jgi:hypothetical protein